MLYACPLRVRICLPVLASHKRIVSSEPPLASVRPSGLNAMLSTLSPCPLRVRICLPVSASHKRIVSSKPPLASVRPSGLNATLPTLFVCPLRVRICLPVLASHKRIVRSRLPLASVRPSGLNTTLLIVFVCPLKMRFRTVYCSVCFPSPQVTSTRNTPGSKGPVIVTVLPFVFAVPVFTRKFSGVLSNRNVKTASASIVLPTRGLTETSVADFPTVYCSVCFPSPHVTSTRNAPELNGPVSVIVSPFVFAVPVFTRTS